jgi:hypothetical protein
VSGEKEQVSSEALEAGRIVVNKVNIRENELFLGGVGQGKEGPLFL